MASASNCSALVTGAGGFVGAWLAASLARSGRAVHCSSLSGTPPSASALAALAPEELARLHWHAADISNAEQVDQLVQATSPDEVYHLAGISRPADSRILSFYEVHVEAVVLLGEAIRKHAPAARTLVVGSAYAYGNYDRPIAESDPFAPLNHYGASKAAGDVVAQMLASDGLDVVRVRPFNHSGPGQSPDFVVPTLVGQLAKIHAQGLEPVITLAGLDSVRDFCDVRDVVQCYVAAMEHAESGAVFNVGSGAGTTIGDLFALARSVTGMDHVQVRVDETKLGPDPLPYLVADVSRAREKLGWRATTELQTTIRDMFNHDVQFLTRSRAQEGSGVA